MTPWVSIAAVVCGCCATPPPVERYFNRLTPESALLGFVYAIDIGDFDHAYDVLDDETREHITSGSFKLAILFYKEPDFETPIRELLRAAISRRTAVVYLAPERARVTIFYEPGAGDGIIADVFLARDADGFWRVNLLATLQQLYGNRPEYVASG